MNSHIGVMDRVRATVKGAGRVWNLSGRNKLPIVVEADDFKSLQKENEGWRQAGGNSSDLVPWSQSKMQKVALALFQKNHMAGRLLNMIVDFVMGDGINVQAKHEDEDRQEEIKAELDLFWGDPINAMDRKNPKRCLDLQLWGEICMPVRVNEADGRTRLGWIDPTRIMEVRPDPLTGEPGTIVLDDSVLREVGQKELEVIRYREDTDTWEGDCFFYNINNVTNALRGISELYSAADWFDILDQIMKGQADRVKLLSRFIWDVTLQGANEEEIVDWLRKNGRTPPPGAIRAHNEKVTWKAEAPSLGSYESTNQTKLLKTHILGGFGYPNHWFGSGEDANLATATMMAEPTRKALRKKGKDFKWILTDIVRFALLNRQKAGFLQGIEITDEIFEIVIPDLAGPDMGAIGEAITKITNAITVALERELISQDTAMELFALVVGETGLEIDPEMEKGKIEINRMVEDSRVKLQGGLGHPLMTDDESEDKEVTH